MKKSVQKGTLLFASMMALAAFAMPAAASAVVWGPAGVTTALDGPFSVTYTAQGWGISCATSHFGVKARNPASSTLDVNSATFSSCGGTGNASNCGFTLTATGLPWTSTALSLTAVGLSVGNVNIVMSGASCQLGTGSFAMSGSLGNGAWNAALHMVTYTNSTGLSFTIPGVGVWVPSPALTVNAGLRNTTNVLTLV